MRKAVFDHVVSQFHRPRGPLGRVAGRIMSGRTSNVERNRWMIGLLALEPGHRVLEIGPGPGVGLEAVGQVVTDGLIVGLDHSATMVAQSRARNRNLVSSGRLELREGSAERLPTDLGQFDRIYTMNVWHFWPDQPAVLGSLCTHLAPGGRLAVGFQPRGQRSANSEGRIDRAEDTIRSQLAGAGLTDVVAHRLDIQPPVLCVVGSA